MKLEWFIHPNNKWPWLYMSLPWTKYIPQPKFLQKLYYRISYTLWNHPSNYHWKRSNLMSGCSCIVNVGEKCLWCGVYQSDAIFEDKYYGRRVYTWKKAKEYYLKCKADADQAWKNGQWRREPLRWWDNLKDWIRTKKCQCLTLTTDIYQKLVKRFA